MDGEAFDKLVVIMMSINAKLGSVMVIGAVALTLGGCSSAPRTASESPAWVKQPARTVDGGYIVYVASAVDRTEERAYFKAEGAAFQDVANECSFAPKGTRTEDRYQEAVGILSRVYVKVAIPFQDCEAAQQALDPESIHKLANVAMAEQLKRYQDDLATEAEEDEAESTETTPSTAVVAESTPIRDETRFFVVRQQVAYVKELVILSPSRTYAPGAPATVGVAQALQPAAAQVRDYQARNPEVRSWNKSWSSLARQPAVPALAGMSGVRTSRAMSISRLQSDPSRARRSAQLHGERRTGSESRGQARGGSRKPKRRFYPRGFGR